MMLQPPELTCFRIDPRPNHVVHLVFDLPGRPMNVFTNVAIHELGRFSTWLRDADIAGVVISSGKPAFCAGADLTELGLAYDMIMAAPKTRRRQIGFDHFVPLSRALRALETSGKPVAAAISGLALGGGFELALACHRRVVADAPRSGLGLPESLVGLLPGAGGTQRLPRLIGIAAALPVLLDGQRLSPAQALALGAVHQVAASGEEVAAAERWVLSAPDARQPWDREARHSEDGAAAVVAATRRRVLERTHGHYPAPLAILDCIAQNRSRPMDEALHGEMTIFSQLIERPEPRNMITSLFLAKTEYDRQRAAGTLPTVIPEIVATIAAALRHAAAELDPEAVESALIEAGFTAPLAAGALADMPEPAPDLEARTLPGEESAAYWFERDELSDSQRFGQRQLLAAALAAAALIPKLDREVERLADYASIAELGFPAYLGGPFALLRYLGFDRLGILSQSAGLNRPTLPTP